MTYEGISTWTRNGIVQSILWKISFVRRVYLEQQRPRPIMKDWFLNLFHSVIITKLFNLFRKKGSSKWLRRQYREERLKEEKSCLMTNDDEVLSELKQGRYWTREELEEQFHRAKQRNWTQTKKKKNNIQSTATEDFHLLNRIFLRENQQELEEKPHLAERFCKQTHIEKEKLKEIIGQYPSHFYKTSISTTTASNHSSLDHSSTIIIWTEDTLHYNITISLFISTFRINNVSTYIDWFLRILSVTGMSHSRHFLELSKLTLTDPNFCLEDKNGQGKFSPWLNITKVQIERNSSKAE